MDATPWPDAAATVSGFIVGSLTETQTLAQLWPELCSIEADAIHSRPESPDSTPVSTTSSLNTAHTVQQCHAVSVWCGVTDDQPHKKRRVVRGGGGPGGINCQVGRSHNERHRAIQHEDQTSAASPAVRLDSIINPTKSTSSLMDETVSGGSVTGLVERALLYDDNFQPGPRPLYARAYCDRWKTDGKVYFKEYQGQQTRFPDCDTWRQYSTPLAGMDAALQMRRCNGVLFVLHNADKTVCFSFSRYTKLQDETKDQRVALYCVNGETKRRSDLALRLPISSNSVANNSAMLPIRAILDLLVDRGIPDETIMQIMDRKEALKLLFATEAPRHDVARMTEYGIRTAAAEAPSSGCPHALINAARALCVSTLGETPIRDKPQRLVEILNAGGSISAMVRRLTRILFGSTILMKADADASMLQGQELVHIHDFVRRMHSTVTLKTVKSTVTRLLCDVRSKAKLKQRLIK